MTKRTALAGAPFSVVVRGDVAHRIRVLAGELLERLFATASDDHLGPFGDQGSGYRSTDTGSSTGDGRTELSKRDMNLVFL